MALFRLRPASRIAALLLLAAWPAGCDRAPAQAQAPAAPRPVRVQTVAFTAPTRTETYSGTVQARVQADLAFRVGGKVITRPVSLGDRVARGQVLARLDPADLHYAMEADAQAVAAAAADARNAEADLARYQALGRASPSFLPAEYDRRLSARLMADARLAQAQRQFAQARDALDYTTLRADADGLITALPMQVGQVVAAGQTVASLAHTAEIEMVADVPENRLDDVRAAQSVTVLLWSDPEHPLPGRVREIGALADPDTRTYAVKVALPQPLRPWVGLGMTASVTFARAAGAAVAMLPASALADRGGLPAVWVLDPDRHHATLRPVSVAWYGGDGSVALRGGVRAGEQVITAGADQLDPNLPIVAWAGPVR